MAETIIHDGSVVANPADQLHPKSATAQADLVTVRVFAGRFAGRVQLLPAGSYGRTLGDPTWTPQSRAEAGGHILLEIESDRPGGGPMVRVVPGRQPVVIGDSVLATPREFLIGDRPLILNMGSERLTISLAKGPPAQPRRTESAVHRVPRVAIPSPVPLLDHPEIPKPPGVRPGLSWIMLLAPVPMAAMMTLFMGPRALVFGLMSPVMVLAKLWETRRSHARRTAEYEVAVNAARGDFYHQVVASRYGAADHERLVHPGPGVLVERAITADPRLWERRPAHDDFGSVVVGYADLPWRYEPVNGAGQPAKVAPELTEYMDGFSYLPSVPVAVSLRHGSLGIVGPRELSLAATRGILVALTTLSGPADLPMALIGSEHHLGDWDWTKWLPHLGSPNRLGLTAAEVLAIVVKHTVDRPDRPGTKLPPRPLSVLVIDGVDLLRRPDSPLRSALTRDNAISGIVVAATEDELPASCQWVMVIANDGLATVTDMATGRSIQHVTPIGMDAELAAETARSMAPLTDPDVDVTAATLPSHVPLRTVIGSIAADAVLSRWDNGGVDPAPVATIGVGPDGPLPIDLVRDGPHALLAGTTGAGKSEFLRSFVLSLATRSSPEHVNFVLVDYKGGGAFDACADLPHSVALVTDLDGHLGARALRSLQAELRYREITFRATGAKDVGDYRLAGGVMPRLVVVVDEFATLAAELPEFLDALVDVAQRGRSLGIHMVLATQRPAGVLDAKIKSNTNLRISLRVQDDNDSLDVIGTNQAARLGRAEMGRGFVRMGASEIVPFQAAYTGGVTPVSSARTGITTAAYRLQPCPPPTEDRDLDGLPSDLDQMVAEIVLANEKSGLSDPRKPWLPELPTTLLLSDLPVCPTPPGDVVIGILDVPSEQRREPLSICVSAGNSVIYGADSIQTSSTLRTLIAQLLRTTATKSTHLYLLDSAAAGLRDLRNGPSVGAYVCHDDDDLLGRILDLVEGLMERRKELRASGGDLVNLSKVIVVIDGLGSLVERLGENADHATLTRVGSLLRSGPNLGITAIGTASHDRQIPSRFGSQIGTKLLHQLADPAAVVSFGLRPRDVPALAGPMVLEVRTGLDGVVATVSDSEIAKLLEEYVPANLPLRLRLLQPIVVSADLEIAATYTDRRLSLPIGVRTRDVTSIALPIEDHAVVLGAAGSGRTTALVQLTAQARTAGLERVVVFAEPESPLAAIPGVERLEPSIVLEKDELATVETAQLVVIDNADRIARDLGVQLKAMAQDPRKGRWILAAMRPTDVKSMMEWTAVFRGSTVGVLLRPQAADGDSLRAMLTNKAVADLRLGQGILVVNGEMTTIQLAGPGPNKNEL
ncbi:MAG: hypothetical protein HKN03_07460 [Acidimicrobiales bacterium]|nr:hypothetical protein [Acidimicrobiales bacterium]